LRKFEINTDYSLFGNAAIVALFFYLGSGAYGAEWGKSGMNPKMFQYLMGHSDIGVRLNTYTHLGLEDAADELKWMEDLEVARKELEKAKGEKPVSQKMFRAI